ncbi:LuxR C-terminal-related transcriptional regulator [Dyadobacter jiangsuensis]
MKIALIDSHQIFTEALKVNLLKSLPGLETINIYSSIEAFLGGQSKDPADLVITELIFNSRFDKGVDSIFSAEPKAEVIILSSMTDEWRIRNYMNFGAKAFLSKTCPFQELLDAIAQVKKGNLFLSQDIQDMLWAELSAGGPSLDNLSSIERGILDGLSRDEPFKTIARNLNISMIELKYYRRMLMERFSLKHFSDLIEIAKKKVSPGAGTSQGQQMREKERKAPGADLRRRKLAMSAV